MDFDRLSELVSPDMRAAALLVLAIFILGRIPILKFLILPFSIFGVIIHELAHALATLATGGQFRYLTVWYDPRDNEVKGQAVRIGGDGCLVGNAGYLGAVLFAALLLVIATSSLSARLVLLVLGGGLLLLTALFIRNAFGIVAGILIGVAMIAISRGFPEVIAKGVLWITAVAMFFDVLFHLIHIPMDSFNLQKRTGINFGFWIVLWQVLALLIIVYALNRAYGVPLPWTLLGRGG